MPKYKFVSTSRVRDDDGREYDVAPAVDALPWVSQLCPQMPHQYAVLFKSPDWARNTVDTMVSSRNPETYRAYFRGYQRPNRYWEAPDGLRYWRTGFMINRCEPDSVEPLRRVDQGAKPITDWDGPPWAPDGVGLYEPDDNGKWWPTKAALDAGYQPCRACQVTRKEKR